MSSNDFSKNISNLLWRLILLATAGTKSFLVVSLNAALARKIITKKKKFHMDYHDLKQKNSLVKSKWKYHQ